MKRALLWRTCVFAWITLATGLVAATGAFEFPAPKLYRPAAGVRLQTVEEDCDQAFDVRFQVRVAHPQGAATLQFNRQPNGDGYEVQFSPNRIRLVKVEAGLVFDLASADRVRLSRKPTSFVLKRRPRAVTLLADGRVALQAFDGELSGGGVAFVTQGIELREVRVQPVDALFYTDDFMKPAGEMGEWQPLAGKWQINSLQNPVLSINAFSMLGTATKGPAVCAAGYWFWDNYRYEVSFQGPSTRAAGIAFCVQDGGNYYFVTRNEHEWCGMGRVYELTRK